MPRVSVIIPTYNRAVLVCEAVQSVLAQTYQNYEIIVIDDGSTDDTATKIKSLGDKVRYIYQKNQGRSAARNLGIKLAEGEYIAFLDSDDLFLPEKLQIQVQALDDNPCYGMVYSYADVISESGILREESWKGNLSGWIYPQMLFIKNNLITTPTVMVKASVLEEIGGFDESMNVCEDLDLWRQIARKYPILHILNPLSRVRFRDNELINIIELIEERKAYYNKAYRDDPQLGRRFKIKLFSEMFFRYGLWAFHLKQKSLARNLVFKSLSYEPLRVERYLVLIPMCLSDSAFQKLRKLWKKIKGKKLTKERSIT